MARSKAIVAESVIGSDNFLEMSHGAQSLYPQLLLCADVIGVFSSVKKTIKGTGHTEGEFQELLDNGFVSYFDDLKAYVIMDWWNQNKHQSRDANPERSDYFYKMTELFGDICSYSGRYIPTETQRETVGNIKEQNSKPIQIQRESNANSTEIEWNVEQDNIEESDNNRMVSCPFCGVSLRAYPYEPEMNLIQCECPTHGIQIIDRETGELFEL